MDEAVRQEWDEFDGALEAGLRAMGLVVPVDRRQRLFEHYRLVVEANRQFNLTRITSPADAAVKHYADSLSLLATPWVCEDAGQDSRRIWVREGIPAPAESGEPARPRAGGPPGRGRAGSPEGIRFLRDSRIGVVREGIPAEANVALLKVLDVGTGAGYPAVPLAVVCPAWSVTAIDGTGKKVRFVEESAVVLSLTNLDTMHARAADLVRDGDWRFDLVLVRAVGQMDKVLAETVPLLGPSGAVVFYKTAHIEQAESDAAAVVAKRLRLRMDAHRVDLPLGGEVLARQLIRYGRDTGSGRKG